MLEMEHRLVGDIYDAAIQPDGWAAVMENISRMSRAEQGTLLAYDRLNPDYFLFHSQGTTPEQLQYYQDGGFAALDQEFTYRWISTPGVAMANHKCFASMEDFKREGGRLYAEFFARVGVFYQAGALLEKEDFRWSALGLHRSEQNVPFEDDIIASIGRLLPHLRRALQIHRQMRHLNQRTAHLYQLLDLFATGVILLDGDHRVRYANRRAEAVLRDGDALRVTSRHHLMAGNAAQDVELKRAFAAATRASRRENLSSEAGGVVGLRQDGDGMPLLATVTPLSAHAGYQELAHDGIAVALFLNDPRDRQLLSRALLRKTYGLSDREVDLCQKFVGNPSIEGVAGDCGITEGTARTYFKTIYAKTGQHSQAELMRLLMGLTLDFEHLR